MTNHPKPHIVGVSWLPPEQLDEAARKLARESRGKDIWDDVDEIVRNRYRTIILEEMPDVLAQYNALH